MPMRVVDTEAFTSVPRPPSHLTLMPRSMELMSLPQGVVGYATELQPAVAISCQVHSPALALASCG